MTINTNEVADRLIEAKRTGVPVETLIGEGEPGDTRLDALRVAQEVVRRRELAGDRQVGFKLGNIAKAMQDKFGVDEPDYGPLLASQFYSENLRISEKEFIEPFVELEPAFVLKKDLGGSTVTPFEVVSATDFVLPAIEIIDSRVKNWNIGILDTIADGGSIGGVITSAKPRKLSELDLANTHGEIRYNGKVVASGGTHDEDHYNGEVVASGNTSAIYGNPVSAIAWLCRRVAEYGITFKAGDLILPGSCLAAERLYPGTQVTGTFAGWGDVSFEYAAN
ncbi:MAG: 2-keto-4-pentenoate hydratase [Leucobacter sp.]